MSAETEFVEHVAALAPVFTAPPGDGSEFRRPSGWSNLHLEDNDARLKEWEPRHAVCAVTGGLLAVVDVDPQNNGDVERVRQLLDGLGVRVFAQVATPGGGQHFYVAGHPELPTCRDLRGYPGVDVQSHGANVFLPGTRRPKYDGRGYRVVCEDLDALADGGDPDGAELFMYWVATHRKTRTVEPFTPSQPWDGDPPDKRQAAYLQAVLDNQHAKVAQTPQGGRNPALYQAAMVCGNYVAGAGLDEEEVVRTLRDAAALSGLLIEDGEQAVQASIRSGLRNGKAKPRAVPPAPPVTVLESSSPVPAEEATNATTYPFITGGSFILDTSPDPTPLWGHGSEVLWADGEALILAGGQGAGKTTLGQQLALGRCGFPEYADLLGYPIAPGNGRTLYLAMDRPKQAARSFRRMVGEAWRNELDDRLVVWQGPPPFDLAKTHGLLLDLCRKADADSVVVDSLKDAAIGLTDDEVGAGYNRARQTALAGGVQVVELHHNRKNLAGSRADINDLYGSTWLTSGAGSVVMVHGAPGDPIVRLQHLKQPADEVGPLQVVHDHAVGRSSIWHATDLLQLASRPEGLSAVEAAQAFADTDRPSRNDKEKARRRLEKAEREGLLRVIQEGNQASSTPRRWGTA